MVEVTLLFPAYFALRLAAGFHRAAIAIDIIYIAILAAMWWQTSPLVLLSLPYFLAAAAIGGGIFRHYAGVASAFSLTGVYLLYRAEPYLQAVGFLLAVLSPAALLPTMRDKGSLEAIFRYLIISSFASAMFFIGIGNRGAAAGELFLFLALALELGAAPMFLWVPDVYGRGHPAGLAILASLPKLGSAFALVALKPAPDAAIPYVLGALSMLLGNLGALTSADPRRILAYSTVAHAGFALFIYPVDPRVTLALVLADAFGKMGLFYGLAGGSSRWGARTLVIHQIGIPPLFGFWPKLLIVLETARWLGWLPAVYVLANIAMTVPYYFRLMDMVPQGAARFPSAVAAAVTALGVMAPLWLIYNLG